MWKEIPNNMRTFQDENNPELIHVIKTGFDDKFMVVSEDAFEVVLGKVTYFTKKALETTYGINLDDSLSAAKTIEEEPVLAGYTNKVFGWNGYKLAEIGTPVYEFKDRYFFEIEPLNGGPKVKVRFYKEDLKNAINFLNYE